MLLFISLSCNSKTSYPLIQIHLMLLFILLHKQIRKDSTNSNTSHVIVYLAPDICVGCKDCIQIHLMLLFIAALLNLVSKVRNHSNTSHVIVYLLHPVPFCNPLIIQIHLMLLFIQIFRKENLTSTLIQIHLMLLFILFQWAVSDSQLQFKYISCYCLSRSQIPAGYWVDKFKYISCYCLSWCFRLPHEPVGAFKYISCYCLSCHLSLRNTA